MEKLKFKTNINCGGCIAKFTPHIKDAQGVQAWSVDTTTPDKVLTIEGDLTESEAIALVTKAGFQVRAVVHQ